MALVGARGFHLPSLPLVSEHYHRPHLWYRASLPDANCNKLKLKMKSHVHLLAQKCSSQQPAVSLTATEMKEAEQSEMSRTILIWRAVKLPIYSVALVPLTVGSAAAYLQTGFFATKRYLLLLFASVFVIAWLNLSNDVYDYETGVDINKKESVINIIGSQAATYSAAITSLVLGFMGFVWVCAEAGDIRFILLASSAILCGYIYQCPPFRLSYQGLGEPLCFSAFGPFATTAFYFAQSSKNLSSGMNHLQLSATVLCASVLVGLTTTFILFCSHFHQMEIVQSFLCAITIPMGKLVMDFIEQNHNNKIKIFMAKYYCVRLHTLFGAALAVGLVVARDGLQLISKASVS